MLFKARRNRNAVPVINIDYVDKLIFKVVNASVKRIKNRIKKYGGILFSNALDYVKVCICIKFLYKFCQCSQEKKIENEGSNSNEKRCEFFLYIACIRFSYI